MKPLAWLADKDQIGHATDPADRYTTLCGKKAVIERLAWPAERQCRVCLLRAGELMPQKAS